MVITTSRIKAWEKYRLDILRKLTIFMIMMMWTFYYINLTYDYQEKKITETKFIFLFVLQRSSFFVKNTK